MGQQFYPGDRVRVKEGNRDFNGLHWNPEMDVYVGRVFTVQEAVWRERYSTTVYELSGESGDGRDISGWVFVDGWLSLAEDSYSEDDCATTDPESDQVFNDFLSEFR